MIEFYEMIVMSSNRLDFYKLGKFFFFSTVLLLTVPGAEGIKQEVDGDGQKLNWECETVGLHLHKCLFLHNFLAVNSCFPL